MATAGGVAGKAEKRWELFGRRGSSLIGGSGRGSSNDGSESNAPGNTTVTTPRVSAETLSGSLEMKVSTALKSNEKCLIAVRVSKIPVQEGSNRGLADIMESSGDEAKEVTSLPSTSKGTASRRTSLTRGPFLVSPRKGSNHSVSTPRSPKNAKSEKKSRILAICEGKKSSQQLRLHKLADYGSGKLSVRRTWWLTELTKIDGMGGTVESTSSFALIFGESKRFAFAARNPRERAEFLWELLQFCATRIGRAPPVEGLRILELQSLAQSVSSSNFLDETRPRHLDPISPGGESEMDTDDHHENLLDDSGGSGDSAPRMGPRQGSVEVKVKTDEDHHAVRKEELLSPKAKAAEIRINRKMKEQEKAEREKIQREKAILEAAAALDEMLDGNAEDSDRIRAELRRKQTAEKKAMEKRRAAEREAMKLSPQDAEDLERMFANHTEVLGTAVNRRKFMDHLTEKMRRLETENTHQIIHSEEEATKVAASLDSLHSSIGGAKEWLTSCQAKISQIRQPTMELESELLVHEIHMRNLKALHDKVLELREAVTLTSHDELTLKDCSLEKIGKNENDYLHAELLPALNSLQAKLEYKPRHELVLRIRLVREGREKLEGYRQKVSYNLYEHLNRKLDSIRELFENAVEEDPVESPVVKEFAQLSTALAHLDTELYTKLWTSYEKLSSASLRNTVKEVESVPSDLDIREMVRQLVSVVSPICQEESRMASILFRVPIERDTEEENSNPALSQFGLAIGRRIDAAARKEGRHLYLPAWAELELEKAFLVMDERNAADVCGIKERWVCPLQKALILLLHVQAARSKSKLRSFVEDTMWQASRAANSIVAAERKEESSIDEAVGVFLRANGNLLTVCRSLLASVKDDVAVTSDLDNQGFARTASVREVDHVEEHLENLSVEQARRFVSDYTKTISVRLVLGAFKNTEVAAHGTNSYARQEMIKVENYLLIARELNACSLEALTEFQTLSKRYSDASIQRCVERFFQSQFGRTVESILTACMSRSYGTLQKLMNDLGRPHRIAADLRFQVDLLLSTESREFAFDPLWTQMSLYFTSQLNELQNLVNVFEAEVAKDGEASIALQDFTIGIRQAMSKSSISSSSLEPSSSDFKPETTLHA